MDVPMLTEAEWALMESALQSALSDLQAYRAMHGCSLKEAKAASFGQNALKLYKELTGFEETNLNALWHHRLSIYGPLCSACGKPLRTPQAHSCAACGQPRSVKGGHASSPV
jgi:hypothetical protein